MPEPVAIHIGSPDTRSSVLVGDVDVSNLVTGVALTAGAGRIPTVTLDLKAQPADFTSEAADITLPPALVALLERLGWSPPDGSEDALTGFELIAHAGAPNATYWGLQLHCHRCEWTVELGGGDHSRLLRDVTKVARWHRVEDCCATAEGV